MVQIFKFALQIDRHLFIGNFREGSTQLPSAVAGISEKEIGIILGNFSPNIRCTLVWVYCKKISLKISEAGHFRHESELC